MIWTARILSTLTLIGLAGSARIVALSLRPERGANMILMVLPIFAIPMLVCAAFLLGIAVAYGSELGVMTHRFAMSTSLLALIGFGTLFFLG